MIAAESVAGGSNKPSKAEDEDDKAATSSPSFFRLDASLMVSEMLLLSAHEDMDDEDGMDETKKNFNGNFRTNN
jgi:hypothetical protein